MTHRRRCLPFRQRLALAEHRSRTLVSSSHMSLTILSRTCVCIRFSFESLVLPNPRLILRSVASS